MLSVLVIEDDKSAEGAARCQEYTRYYHLGKAEGVQQNRAFPDRR